MTGNHPRLQMHHTEARFVNGIKRALRIATRAVAMVFAILGVVLPLLPATPVPSDCAGCSIPLRAKIVTLMILCASLAISIIRVELVVLELALVGS